MSLDKLPSPRYPPGFSKDDFEFSKLYKCVQEEGSKAMQKIFKTMYSQPVMNTDNGKLTLKKYLNESCKRKMKDIKEKYKRWIRVGLLDSNLMEEVFDISFGYVIIEDICGVDENRKFISEELWEGAEWLKLYRCNIAHVYGVINGDLHSVLNNLCDRLRKIYKLIENEFYISCTKEIEDMEKFIETSRLFEIKQDDMESYKQDVKKFRDDNRVSMTIDGRKEMFKRDSKGIIQLLDSYLESLNPCTFLVSDKTTKLTIMDNYVMPNIMKNKFSFDLKALFVTFDDKCKELPKVIFMKGKSNSGKTSLCKFLLHSWASNKKSVIRQTDFDLTFYINVYSLRSKSLEAVFKNELLPKSTSNFLDRDIIPTLQDLSVLFFIDSFELRNKQTNYIIEEIFSKFGEQSSKSRIFITTTPDDTGALSQLALFKHPYLSLELEGFEETQMRELSQKVFKTFQLENIDDNVCKFETHIKNLMIEPEYFRLPGHIILILILWIEGNKTLPGPQSLTSLYQNIFSLCAEKFKEYLKNSFEIDIEMKKVIDIFHIFGQNFLSNLKQDTNISSQDIFLELEAISPMKGNIQKIVTKLLDSDKDDNDARILINKTQIQYIAASYLFSKVNESDVEELLQCYDVHNFTSIIIFFVGIANINGQFDSPLASDTIKTIEDQLYISGEDFEFWWTLVSECPTKGSCGYDSDICSLVADALDKEWNLGEDKCVEAIKLLKFTPVKPQSIRLYFPLGTDSFSIPELRKAFQDLKPTFQLHDTENSYKIDAHFYEQFEGKAKSIKLDIPFGTEPFSIPILIKAFQNLKPTFQLHDSNKTFKIEANFYEKFKGNYSLNEDQFILPIKEDSVGKSIQLLNLTSAKPIYIKIEIPLGTDPFSISGLLKAFEELKNTFQLHDSKESFKIEAHFYDHFEGNNLSYSDQLLLSIANLYPHAQLISFTGHFGDTTAVYNKLGKCYKLESINARFTKIDSLKALISLCLNKLKKLKNVHICLDISTKCDQNSLPQFPRKYGKLSLTFPNVTSVDDLSWLEACVIKLTNGIGCQELHGGTGFQIPKDLLHKMGIK